MRKTFWTAVLLAACGGSGTSTHTLTVTADGLGSVSTAPSGILCRAGACSSAFSPGATVTLTAHPNAAVTATFSAPANSHKLTVSVSGNGSVASSPSGISCPSGACTSFFTDGTAVSLTATPDMNQTFSGWTGVCSGTAPCTVNISADAS